jgi:hypothetical protein
VRHLTHLHIPSECDNFEAWVAIYDEDDAKSRDDSRKQVLLALCGSTFQQIFLNRVEMLILEYQVLLDMLRNLSTHCHECCRGIPWIH